MRGDVSGEAAAQNSSLKHQSCVQTLVCVPTLDGLRVAGSALNRFRVRALGFRSQTPERQARLVACCVQPLCGGARPLGEAWRRSLGQGLPSRCSRSGVWTVGQDKDRQQSVGGGHPIQLAPYILRGEPEACSL